MHALRTVGLLACTLVLVAGCGGGGTDADAGADGGGTDAFVSDVGPHDASIDAATCVTAADCDDGLFCNGAETCTGGRCAASAPACDDHVACTVNVCDETMRACTYRVPDVDGDGYGDARCVDATGTPLGTDCADTDALTYPGNRETCDADGHDEDCDPTTHGDIDADGDGVESHVCCNPDPAGGGALCGADCDDARAATHPGATETCDTLDQDCDGAIDEGTLLDGFVDADHDGYGVTSMPIQRCAAAVGFARVDGDCDDASPSANPGLPELCDPDPLVPVDNNCDGSTTDAPGTANWYTDRDGDGFGSAASGATVSCLPVAGAVLLGTDCDDDRADINPAQAERCDGIDDDCNGLADFEVPGGNREDDDGDGFVDILCPLGNDCDDDNAAAGPGGVETCDGRDNDCDMHVDEDATTLVYYTDADGDGYGTVAGRTIVACMASAGYVTRAGDCADDDVARHPGATEACNSRDDDCDSAIDEAPAVSACGSVAGGVVGCIAGTCAIARCSAGYLDCDGDPANGCEVHPADDVANCGGCGLSCAAPAAAATACTAGRCSITRCLGGFADCDRVASDGCEVNVTNDPEHCGTCTTTCPMRAYCSVSSCIAGCAPGQIACGSSCVDPSTDLLHCGAAADCAGANAGVACAPGESCVNAVCRLPSRLSPVFDLSTASFPRDVVHTIDTADPATVHYTVDGSDPATSPTAMVGPAPVSLTLTLGATLQWYAEYGTVREGPTTHTYRPVASGVPSSLGQIVENVSLNGGGPIIAVAPGTMVSGSLTTQHWRSDATGYCPGCIIQSHVSVDGVGTPECHSMDSGWYPGDVVPVTFNFVAPAVRGTYYVRVGLDLEVSCASGTHFGGQPVGIVYVR